MATQYEIRVRGHLRQAWSEWFAGLEIERRSDGTTALTGPLPDQAALFGVLIKLRDLGLTLVSIVELDRSN
jgi:hypothetical protein